MLPFPESTVGQWAAEYTEGMGAQPGTQAGG